MTDSSVGLPDEIVKDTIFLIRQKRVVLDSDLALLYGVSTKLLNHAVERNKDRFPEDFMFQLTVAEAEHWQDTVRSRSQTASLNESQPPTSRSQTVSMDESQPPDLRSQIVTLNDDRGENLKYLPYAFTEQGILMLSSVLNSERAVQVNIQIMRTFVRLRDVFAANEIILRPEDELENNCDEDFNTLFRALRQQVTEDKGKKNKIGFRVKATKDQTSS